MEKLLEIWNTLSEDEKKLVLLFAWEMEDEDKQKESHG